LLVLDWSSLIIIKYTTRGNPIASTIHSSRASASPSCAHHHYERGHFGSGQILLVSVCAQNPIGWYRTAIATGKSHWPFLALKFGGNGIGAKTLLKAKQKDNLFAPNLVSHGCHWILSVPYFVYKIYE
jgi:hypothetical protein